ncbi:MULTISPECIES: HAD-IIA family hydrolase [unclassified Dietzia]|uniref:HAD-IIA family hydrolase n=1 Tax=unclassified Dietzia TaxID=2617939 RepID=UPI0015FE090C|nr:HAD-IIA family hydrolase [Dietzia sp. DQ12-76]MBB1024318.1 HAD-IIA family hydrolase [Dietzia sp. DQ12-76]MBB1027506.1 HAD-IIA family hydrolase [Dietzia sp. DQ11-38-2]
MATLSDLHDALLADLDGTLIRGTEPIPGAAEALDRSGLPVVYVTNNASRSPGQTAEHLRDLGFPARASDVMTSAQAAVMMLGDHVDAGARVLVVGHESFRELARQAGYEVVYSADDGPEAVLQGLSRELTWGDLAEGCLAIRRGVPWVASNTDTTLPTERGLLPGNGSLVAALRAATDRDPVVAGKPAAGVLRAAADLVGSRRPLVIGDRLDTDIEGALAAGMPALLVLTGVHGTADLLAADAHRRATHLAPDLSALAAPPESSHIDSAPWLDARVENGVLHLDGLPATLGGVDLARGVLRQAWRHGVSALADPGDGARSRFADAGLLVG